MEQRINVYAKGLAAMRAIYGLGLYTAKASVEKSLMDLVFFRISQINGCAYCLSADAKTLRDNGESEQRLFVLNAWRESTLYTERERAALAWAEAVTNVQDGHVSDDVYEAARIHFSEEELIDLTVGVLTINCYNRVNIAFRITGGAHEPAVLEGKSK
ncbi:MAG TPA: carboxymuconolactone decarboxylase family protein [Chitinophaga sp.]